LTRYPPNTPEKQKDLGAWFGEHPPQATAAAVLKYVEALKKANPSIKSWGIIGVSAPLLATSLPT
jgi:hypothetical protein